MQFTFRKSKVMYLYGALALLCLLLALVSKVRAEEATLPARDAETLPSVTLPDGEATPGAETTPRTLGDDVREDAVRALLNKDTHDRFVNLIRNVVNRMEGAIERFDNIANRLETRIQKVGASGADTSIATTHLTAARTYNETAKTALAEAQRLGELAMASDAPRETFIAARNEFDNAKNAIYRVSFELKATIDALKNPGTGTTTPASVTVEFES